MEGKVENIGKKLLERDLPAYLNKIFKLCLLDFAVLFCYQNCKNSEYEFTHCVGTQLLFLGLWHSSVYC